ncbi:MAG: hypothetical protein MK213_07255, partial [Planctomycetes bacterium]|nr:hypothetical protein [Planctomycetota bacterium]
KSVWGTGLWHASQAPELSWGNPTDEVLQSLPPQTSSTPPPSWLLPNQVFPTVLESSLRHQGLLLVCFLFGLRWWTQARRGIRGGALRVTPAVAVLGLGIFPPPVTTVFWEGGGTIWEGQLQMGGVWRPADGRFQAGGGVTEVQRRKEGGWAVKGGPWIAWTTPARTSSPLNLLELDAWAPWSWGEDPQDRGKWRRTSSGALFRFPRETQE